MAFTQLLVLSLMAAATTAQFANTGTTFGSVGGLPTNYPTNTAGGLGSFPGTSIGYPTTNTGIGYPSSIGSRLPGLPTGGGSFPGSFPQFGSSQQTGARLATVHATNKAGDHLYLTIEEQADLDNPYANPFNPFGQGQNPFDNDDRDLRVHGVFVKAGAQTGVTSPESLHGTFAMVVTRNGNTDGYCIGTGDPYRVRSNNQYNPYDPLSSFGRNPYSNPFSQFFPQQQQGQAVLVSTPLHASTGTSTIEGQIRNVRLTQLHGRAIHVCADTECKVRTDLCGTIRRDDKTVEEFKAYQQHHATLTGAQGLNTGGFGNVPYDPFAATAGGPGAVVGGDTGDLLAGGTTGGGGGLF